MEQQTITLVISIVSLVGTLITFVLGKIYNIGKSSKRLDYIEKLTEELKNDVREVHDDMIRVQAVLSITSKGAREVFSTKHSPRILNELGLKIFREMHGDDFLKENKARLFEKINERKPQTALDVENAAYWACSSFVDDTMFNPIKNFVYNCPMLKLDNGEEREFSLGDACFLLGVKLRDLYLAESNQVK